MFELRTAAGGAVIEALNAPSQNAFSHSAIIFDVLKIVVNVRPQLLQIALSSGEYLVPHDASEIKTDGDQIDRTGRSHLFQRERRIYEVPLQGVMTVHVSR